MTTSHHRLPKGDLPAETNASQPVVENLLHRNTLRLPSIFFLCIAAIAPAASMLFNIPVMASQAGASTPLVFVLSSFGIILLALPVLFFASRLSSAGGFATWVRAGLGARSAFLTSWLMLGGYALFEAALQSTVGGSLDLNLSRLGFHLVGGWVTYAAILTLLVGILSYFALTASVWVMAPFAVAEVLALLLLNVAITVKGGAAGQDLSHTFLPAGALVKGVAPGGLLGIGVAMTLGILAFVGFETAAAYGEEARHPRRTIPVAVLALLLGLSVLYIWTAYAATIGIGWQHAGTILGNVATAPQQYILLATTYVGSWLGLALVLFVLTSNFASAFAMHQAMTRYCYDLGRSGLVPSVFGRTHPRWKSPYVASITQTVFSLLVIGVLGLMMQHTNQDGSVVYALGFAHGSFWQQTSGTVSFGWLASIVTMMIILVYLLTNIAAPFFAAKRKELRLFPHLIAPALSSLFLLIPLVASIGPALPGGVGDVFTRLGFAPTPFPSNLFPLVVLGWVVLGWLYSLYRQRRRPGHDALMGQSDA